MYYVGSIPCVPADVKHFGILGMKWGVRRYQNDDGTLTSAGKKRYADYEKKYGGDPLDKFLKENDGSFDYDKEIAKSQYPRIHKPTSTLKRATRAAVGVAVKVGVSYLISKKMNEVLGSRIESIAPRTTSIGKTFVSSSKILNASNYGTTPKMSQYAMDVNRDNFRAFERRNGFR